MAHLEYENGYYDGDLNYNDERHGYGTYVWNDGDKYVGEWRNNERNGHGTFKSDEGWSYTGEWRDDKRNGRGKCTYSWGYYEGEWKNDDWGGGHGIEAHTNSDGVVFEGNFIDHYDATNVTCTENGKKTKGKLVNGSFEADPLNGFAREDYDNGYYEGNFVNGKRQGQGKYVWNDGAVYEGDWRDNKRCGQGEMKYSDGHFYKGEWRDSERNGRGTFIFKNENMKYEGEWRDDKPYGRGVITMGETTYSGIFDGWNSSSIIKTTSTERLGCPGKLIDWKFIPDKLPEVEEDKSPTKNKHEYATYSYNLGEYKVTEFEGKKVYYKDGTFSFSPENIERMNRSLSRVLAPIGADGQSVQLHHTTQKDDSPIVEILFSIHKGWDSTLHDPAQRKYGSDINRPNFENWKKRYWKHRVEEYLKNH